MYDVRSAVFLAVLRLLARMQIRLAKAEYGKGREAATFPLALIDRLQTGQQQRR